jgi:hypothetical protein
VRFDVTDASGVGLAVASGVVTTEGDGDSDEIGVTVGPGEAVGLSDAASDAADDAVGVGEPMGSAAANGVATMPSASPIKAALTALEIRPIGEQG